MSVELKGRHVEEWDPVTVTRRRADVQSAAGVAGRATLMKSPHAPAVRLDLPIGGSCFLVVTDDVDVPVSRQEVVREKMALDGPWQVTFRYPDGIAAQPPARRRMDILTDWTKDEDLKYFVGTATYRQSVTVKGSGRAILSLGHVPSGVAHVFVNGVDCGAVWCAPWEADISAALKDGNNEIEIRYTNNWENRLIGDTRLPEERRVTRHSLWTWKENRYELGTDPKVPWLRRPTVYSGYSAHDPLQSCGLMGPVTIEIVDFLLR